MNNNWQIIENQNDLDMFSQSINWSDCESIEFFGTPLSLKDVPQDVNRSVYANKNIFILCQISSKLAPYLEVNDGHKIY